MASKRKGLGRGLDALLSQSQPAAKPGVETNGGDGELKHIDVDLLERGQYQPRVDMRQESLEELADSIRAQGVVQPIVVRPVGARSERRFEIIAGERRWRAAQIAGLETVPAIVRNVTDSAAVAMALIENIQREDLNPLEEASALNRLMDEFDMTHAQAAEAVGRSRASVTNLIRLLELEPTVKRLLEERKLAMGHARALLGLSGKAQLEAAREVVARALSVRSTEQLVKRMTSTKPAAKTTTRADPDVQRLQDGLSGTLGARVTISHGAGGKGKLTIPYNSLDELEGILSHIR